MWACARGHKSAMLTLNQWNPVALLSLAKRYTAAPPCDVTVTSSCPLSRSFQRPHHPTGHILSPTTLLADSDKDVEHEELLHVEQSVTIAYTSDSPQVTEQTSDSARSMEQTSECDRRTSRLKKRTSVDVLPSHVQRRTSTPKISKTASVGDAVEIPAELSGSPDTWPMTVLPPGELRVSNSDSHLSGLSKSGGPDPMISMIDHDINSPPMTFTGDMEIPAGFPMGGQPASYVLPCESMSVDIGKSTVMCADPRDAPYRLRALMRHDAPYRLRALMRHDAP